MARTRRALLAVLLLVFALVAACGGSATTSSANQKVHLTMWTFLDNSSEVAVWNSTHPNIQITAQKVPSDDYYAKLQAAVKAGNAPDVALVEYQFVPTMIAGGVLAGLNGKISADLAKHYPSWVWNQVDRDGTVYAVPQDIAPMALFYRKDDFAKFGLTVPATWQQYQQDAQTLHAADPSYSMAAFATNEAGQWAGLTWQNGARWFGTQGQNWTVSVNSAPSQQVGSYWQQLIAGHLVKTEPDFSTGWVDDLTTGKVATWVAPVWGGSYLKGSMAAASGQWAVAPMPQWNPAHPAVGNWGGSSIGVTTSSKYPDQAAQFTQWLNSDPASVSLLIQNSSIYPADTDDLSNAAFTRTDPYYGGQNIYQVFRQASTQVNPDFTWGPAMTATFSAFTDEFGKVATGQQTVASALDNLQQRTVAAMKQQGFPLSG